jgi:hypothetical protein
MWVLSENSSFLINRSCKVALIAIVFSAFVLTANSAYAADVLLSPASGSYNQGQTFTVNVTADPKGDSINAVEADLKFDPAVLSVVSVGKEGSAFSLWTTEPEFSNSAGTIAFGGGSPTPFSSRSTLMTVTFRALAEGSGSVSFGTASALAADGRGTDVLDASTGGTYTVTVGETPVTPEPTAEPEPVDEAGDSSAAISFGDPPRAPEVGSPSFLDPDFWYSKIDGLFLWEIPFDVSAVAVEIATSSDNRPTKVFDPPIEEFAVSAVNLSDGVQYLSVQFENQVGWGGITNRKIQIDTTPPEPFDINVQSGTSVSSFPLLVFEANDVTSGIEYYELSVAQKEPLEVTPDEAKLGYLLTELEDGTYTVKIIAYDKAGNEAESTVPVLITAGWMPASDVEEEYSFWLFFTGTVIVIILLTLIAFAEFAYIIYERRQFAKKEGKLRKETREIQDQMEKIFSALRDEIYDQVNAITKRPRLSAKEKEAVEGLNQALEVSETLIEKEINDVKKILK